jgi:hypothetical protein
MKHPAIISLAAPLIAMSLTACGGGTQSESNLTEDEAERAFDETARRTGAAAESAQNESAFTQALDYLAQQLDVDFEAPCAQGGTATLNGSISVPDEQSEEIDTDMNLSVEYQGCAENGITLDGDLSYSSSISQDASGSTEMSLAMTGDLAFSGDIEETCSIDVSIDVSIQLGDFEGGDFDFDIQVDASGNFCGYDINDLDLDTTDPGNFEGV